MIALLLGAALAFDLTVTTPADRVADDGDCTLREAILAANTDAAVDACPAGDPDAPDVIRLGPGTWTLALRTRGPNEEDAARSGDLDVTGALVVRGLGPDHTAIDADGLDRVFDVRPGGALTLLDLTLRGGAPRWVPADKLLDPMNPSLGALLGGGSGGGVRNDGTLIAERVVMRGAVGAAGGVLRLESPVGVFELGLPGGSGMGVMSRGTLRLTDVWLTENTAGPGTFLSGANPVNLGPGAGSALFVLSGQATLSRVTITGNHSPPAAGGALPAGALAVGHPAASPVSFSASELTLGDNTAEGGQATALLVGGSLDASTVLDGLISTTSAPVRGSLFPGPCPMGTLSGGGNLYSATCAPTAPPGDAIAEDPGVLPLGAYGGPFPSYALAPDSPAIDLDGVCGPLDGRGAPRPIGDGCDAGAFEAGCGDGIVDPGEDCDDAGASAACTDTCRASTCGDGVLNALVEACDVGDANADAPGACRLDCALPACGDGIADPGEACDAAGDAPTCTTACTVPVCGDGLHSPAAGEACDAGDANDDWTPDACRADCALPACGDGVVDAGESCDEGAANSDTAPRACRTDCAVWTCGDGAVDPGEDCDDGDDNGLVADACRPTCAAPRCGDGVVDTGEDCDDGPANGLVADACRPDCALPTCGDGVIDAGEACDDGPRNRDTAPGACRTDCALPACGDGALDPGEQCDDGNATADDGCTACAVDEGHLCTLTEAGSECAPAPGCACDGTGGGGWLAGLVALASARRRAVPTPSRPR